MNPNDVNIHKAEWNNAGEVQSSSPDIYAKADGICPWHTGQTDARNYYIYQLEDWSSRVSHGDYSQQDWLTYVVRKPKIQGPSNYVPTTNAVFRVGWDSAMFIDLYAGYHGGTGTSRWGHLVRMCFPDDTNSAYWTLLRMRSTDPDDFTCWAGDAGAPLSFALPDDDYFRVKIGFPYELQPDLLAVVIEKLDGTGLSGTYFSEFGGPIPEYIAKHPAVGWWRLPPFNSTPTSTDRHPDQLPKWMATEFEGDPLAVAVSRDGENWAFGTAGDLIDIHNQNGTEVSKKNIRIATVANVMRPIKGWSVGFKNSEEG